MADRTCPTCKGEFKYPSFLKKHLETTIHCKKTHTEINDIMTTIKNNVNNSEVNKCNFCNKNFKRKDNYTKHINNSICSVKYVENTKIELELKNTISKLTLVNKEKYLKQGDKLVKEQDKNINNTQININTTNNLTINIHNTQINIQHIYPFGFETLPNISKEDMKKLLLSGEKGVIEIIKLVYEKDENKNFYKINMNNNNISYLNDKYKLDICQETEMKDTLYKNCISLPNDMLVICKDILSTSEILYINFNNRNILEKIKEEIYDNGLTNIINTQLIYNSKSTKQNIDKYLTILNSNPVIKEEAINNLNNIKTITKNTYDEFTPSLSIIKINEHLGNPLTEPDLTKQNIHNDFCMKKYEETKYKKYWDKRKKDEKKLVLSFENKSIGDIIALDNRLNKIDKKIQRMEYIHNDITFDKDLDKVEIASDYFINNRNRRIIQNDIANMTDLEVFE